MYIESYRNRIHMKKIVAPIYLFVCLFFSSVNRKSVIKQCVMYAKCDFFALRRFQSKFGKFSYFVACFYEKNGIQIIKITKIEMIYLFQEEHWHELAAVMSKDIKFHLIAENHVDGVDKSDKFVDQTQILLEREMRIERQNTHTHTWMRKARVQK